MGRRELFADERRFRVRIANCVAFVEYDVVPRLGEQRVAIVTHGRIRCYENAGIGGHVMN